VRSGGGVGGLERYQTSTELRASLALEEGSVIHRSQPGYEGAVLIAYGAASFFFGHATGAPERGVSSLSCTVEDLRESFWNMLLCVVHRGLTAVT
jgi:hypothetical protein